MRFTRFLTAALLSTAMVPAVRVMPAQALLPVGETAATDKAAPGKAAAAGNIGGKAADKAAADRAAGQAAGAPATEITIYNQDLALIKKRQQVKLNKGVNEVVFDEVARQMRPESAFIFGDGVKSWNRIMIMPASTI